MKQKYKCRQCQDKGEIQACFATESGVKAKVIACPKCKKAEYELLQRVG